MKLYRKNEVGFAVLCIVVYVVAFGNLRNLGDDSPWSALGMAVMAAALILFVVKNALAEKYGLAGWAKNNRAMLYFIPLWICASGNLWAGIQPDYRGAGLVFAIITMALVGFVEEMLFRGLLFRAMLAGGNTRAAIIVSALTFGIGHIVNLFTGHAVFETLMQMAFAIVVGFLFTMACYKGGSLFPVIIAHSAIDVLSVLSPDRADVASWVYMGVTLVMTVVYCAYLTRVKTPEIRR